MGIDVATMIFIAAARMRGVNFMDTLMIGRQRFYDESDRAVRAYSKLLNRPCPASGSFAEDFFSALGANTVASVDASDYEGATYVHDLNTPLPDRLANLRKRFSVVFDGGSLEHVFNVPAAFSTCMDLVRPGGHFIQITTANNFMGHGFWQFSPELIYRIFSPPNGYQTEMVLLHEVGTENWFATADPSRVGRYELINDKPLYLMTVAKRIAGAGDVYNLLRSPPQQSDYVSLWRGEQDGEVNTKRYWPISEIGLWSGQLAYDDESLHNGLELRHATAPPNTKG